MSRTPVRLRSPYRRSLFFPHARFSSTFSRLWCLVIISLLIVTSLLVAESTLVPEVYAANHAPRVSALLASTHPPHHKPILAPVHRLAPLTSHQKLFTAFPQVSQSSPWDGLGVLPFFTYITHPITSTTCTCGKVEVLVNVANGNLLIHSVEMQIQGTGLNLSIEAYYNSLATYSRDLGQNWNFSIGHDVFLDLSNPSSGITVHGPSGYSAFFAYNSSTQNYIDAPGLNATLVKNNDGTYTLTFHRTGEQWIFASGSHLIAVKDKNGHTISISLDSDNDVLSMTDTQGRVITFTHNTVFGTGHSPEGQITKITDPTGRYTAYSYTNNQLTTETNLNGKTTQYAYAGSDLTQITDPMGRVTKIAYDGSHRVTSITDPQSGVTQFTYNGNSTVVTDALTHTRTYNYNGSGQVISVVNANGITVSNTTYTGNYDMASYQDALTNSTTYSYSQDGNNNLIGITDANNVSTSLSYPSAGSSLPYYPTGSKDPQGNVSSYVYDGSGNLTSSTNMTASPPVSLTYTYYTSGILQGLIHTATDADATGQNGHVTTYGYDAEGNLTSITPPSPQHPTTFTYDSLSRVLTQTDGNGNVTTYTYTKLNRLNSVSYKNSSGGNTSSVSYTYDDDGNPTSVVDSVAGTTSFTYDTLNRQTKKTLPDTSIISYTYDAVSNLLTLTDAGGTVTYGYDNLNEMTSLTEPNGSGGTETLSFGYDNNGRRVSVQYPDDSWDGSATYLIYDNGGRLQEVTRYGEYSDDEDYVYSYSNPSGPSGNYTSLRYSVNSYLNSPQNTGQQWTTSYNYDPLNRLTKATTSTVQGTAYATTSTYQYDANGNRTSGSTSAGSGTSILNPYSNTYQYDSANQLTQVNSGTKCTNDGAGNQTGCGSSYKETYNPRNQTTSMSSPKGSLSMGYTGTDSTERITAGSTPYTYNLLGMGTEKDSSGNVIAYTRDSSGNLIGERTEAGNYFYLFDGLGSVVALVSAKTDAIVNTYIYDPYGVVEQQSGTQYNPWQFAGGYYDATTLYEKFGTRYYDRFGRWTQQDPVPSANPYVYANDDPVNLVDPSGKCSPPTTFFNAVVFVFSALAAGVALAVVVAAIPESVVGFAFLQALGAGLITTIPGYAAIASLGIAVGSEGLLIGCLLGVG